MDISALIYNFVWVLLTLILSGLVEMIRRKLGQQRIERIKAELAAKQELVNLGVAFAEQAYKDMDGPTKFNKALQWIQDQAVKVGIKITNEELTGLIEAAVNTMKTALR